MNLTKDDLYLIEQVLDVYAGVINDNLVKVCDTAMRYDGYKSMKQEKPDFSVGSNPLDETVLGIVDAQKRVKLLRDKLESERLKDDNNK